MKKLIPILFVALVFSACQKEPSLSKLDNDYVVFTDYDSSADFSAFSTYYMPDSILRITNSKDPKYLTGNDAEYILSVYEDNMEARGYTRVDEKDIADLGLQISYVEDVSYFVNYPNSYWWNGYPGYWGPGYWGPGWDYWYYPYPVVYSYSVGSFLAEMVNLSASTEASRRLPILWDAYMAGLLSGSSKLNRDLAIRAVDQAFIQSPYLKK